MDAQRFSELPAVCKHDQRVRGPALAGALCAGLAAWASVKFLMRYFETNRLTPFAWYCLLAGFAALLAFVV